MAVAIVIGLLVITMSIVLISGRGSFLIAGFNTQPENEKSRYDEKRLCRFMGKIFLPIGIIVLFFPLSEKYDISWYSSACTVVILGLLAFALIYANTGNRFRK